MRFVYFVCGGGCNRETIHEDEPRALRWAIDNGWIIHGDSVRCPSCKEAGVKE